MTKKDEDRRDRLAVTLMAAMYQKTPPSTFSETNWANDVKTMARRATQAADLLLAELDGV